MKTIFFLVVLVTFCRVRVQAKNVEYIFGDYDSSYDNSSVREGRVFPFIAVVRLPDETCGSDMMNQGICRTKKQCQNQGGTVINDITCGNGYGVCCQFEMTCSASNNNNGITVTTSGTHITNPSISNNAATPVNCMINLPKPSSDICQVRLDFVKFDLMGPDSEGNCVTDFMTINGADNLGSFITCGQNSGQHLYLHYGTSDTITTSITLNNPSSSYDIMATYLRCGSSTCGGNSNKQQSNNKKKGGLFGNKGSSSSSSSSNNNNANAVIIEPAPPGCTQYYTASSGEVSSFSFVTGADVSTQNQINNERYMVCVKCSCGSNMITWSTCGADAFCISGMPGIGGKTGSECIQDYVDIPGSPAGRYCGCDFPNAVSSSAHPCVLYVNFDDAEEPQVPITDPTTGCPAGFMCVDGFGQPIDPATAAGVICNTPEGIAMFLQCQAPSYFSDMVDDANKGFCLSYSVL